MDFRLNDYEQAFVRAVEQIVRKYRDGPRTDGVSAKVHAAWSGELYDALHAGGFLDAAKEDDFGPVSAVLLIEEAARSPFAVETGVSALVAPLACEVPAHGPFAIACAEDLKKPIRFLPQARTLLMVDGVALLCLDIDGEEIEANAGLYAYPFGIFREPPDLTKARHAGDGERALTYWRIALAAEGAALMQAALDYTVEYVTSRRQFNRPIGSFQAVQHRLAACAQQVRGAIWLARHAAWSGTTADAAMAALYVQHCIPTVVYDCHQFNGAMGMTLECPLHFWTYRMKALQGELGGWPEQALALARDHWGTQAAAKP